MSGQIPISKSGKEARILIMGGGGPGLIGISIFFTNDHAMGFSLRKNEAKDLIKLLQEEIDNIDLLELYKNHLQEFSEKQKEKSFSEEEEDSYLEFLDDIWNEMTGAEQEIFEEWASKNLKAPLSVVKSS